MTAACPCGASFTRFREEHDERDDFTGFGRGARVIVRPPVRITVWCARGHEHVAVDAERSAEHGLRFELAAS
jgi:hypothetical protein